jgi:hypothetical protein
MCCYTHYAVITVEGKVQTIGIRISTALAFAYSDEP